MVDSPDNAADDLGPIDFIVVEFPDGVIGTEGFDELLALVDRGVIGIIDVEFIAKDSGGTVRKVGIAELPGDGNALSVWDGSSSGLLDQDDLAELGASLTSESIAVVVVFENLWILGLVDRWRHQGARLIADGGLSAADVVAALDATEPA